MISIATPSADGADAEEDEERMQWWWYYHSSRRAFLRVVLTEYRYAYVSVFAAEREREREVLSRVKVVTTKRIASKGLLLCSR